MRPFFESSLLTDLYQFTMAQSYLKTGVMEEACFEFFVRSLPRDRRYLVCTGLTEVAEFLRTFSFTPEELDFLNTTGLFDRDFLDYLSGLRFNGDLYGVREGEIMFPHEPICQVVAPLPVAQLMETRIINILHYCVMVASKASRVTQVARQKTVVDFGLRRAHGGEAGLWAAKATYVAGFSGSSTVLSGKIYGIPIFGTMAHSFVQAHPNELTAFLTFARLYPQRPILLVDTYDTKAGIENAITAQKVLEQEGIRVFGIRIDSGDLATLSKEARAMLDRAGCGHMKIIVSGDIDEYVIKELEGQGSPIDGYGVGTRITTSSDAPHLNCAYKLVEYGGQKTYKRSTGKATLPGRKQVVRHFRGEDGPFHYDEIVPFDLCKRGIIKESPSKRFLLVPYLINGRPKDGRGDTIEEARERHLKGLRGLPTRLLDIDDTGDDLAPYEVRIHRDLWEGLEG